MIGKIWTSRLGLGWLVFFGMVAVIASVLAFQYLGGYIPCALCLKQRVPYYAGIPIALFAAIALQMKWPDLLIRAAFFIAGALVCVSLGLGAYHSGVEWGWWAGPSECAATGASGDIVTNADNLLAQLSFSKPPACDEAAGRFLGLSFAGWNVVVSTLLAIMAFRVAFMRDQGSSSQSQ